MTTLTASEVIQQILEHGRKNADANAKRPALISNANFSSQGDISIWKVEDLKDLPSLSPCEPFYQLAPGTSRGSRHCLDKDSVANAKFYKLDYPTALQGGVWCNEEETLVTHPEHGDQILDPGIYFVTYQRQYAEDLKRIAD